jgi:hypothetical protein
MERILTCSSKFLSQAEKLELVNSIFTALPTFYMCTLKIPATIIKQIDIYIKHCLWRGNDINSKKALVAAWSMIVTPKPNRGLGVLKLEIQNETLLLKYLHKFFKQL